MKKISIIITICLIFLTGCFDYHELNDLVIVSTVSINLTKNKNYNITVQVINPHKDQSQENIDNKEFITINSSAKTLTEAFNLLTKKSLNKIYFSHMQVLLLDEDILEKKLGDVLDFLLRNGEIRNEVYVLIAKDKDILKRITSNNNISSETIINSLNNDTKYLGYSEIITLSDLIKRYKNNKREITLPSIKLINNNSNKDISTEVSNIGIFKNNKLLGYLNDNESLGYNFIMNNIKRTIITNNYNNKYIVTEIINTDTKLKPNFNNNIIKIKITGKAIIKELNTDFNTKNKNNIKTIETIMNKNIEKIINDSYDKIKSNYKTDIFGFEELYYKNNNTYYQKIKDNWNNKIFPNINIKVNSNIKIIRRGNLLGSVSNE